MRVVDQAGRPIEVHIGQRPESLRSKREGIGHDREEDRESTDEDESLKLKETKDTLEKSNKQFKTARDASRTKNEKAQSDAKLKCQKADVAEGKLKAVIKAANGASAESKSRNDLLAMQQTMLAAANAEVKRATASAMHWSVKIKELMAKLGKIREMKQANSKYCSAKKPRFMM